MRWRCRGATCMRGLIHDGGRQGVLLGDGQSPPAIAHPRAMARCTGLTNLYSFTATYPFYPYPSLILDGANPQSGLNLSDNALYGTTANGGSSGNGTVFSISFQPQLTIP